MVDETLGEMRSQRIATIIIDQWKPEGRVKFLLFGAV